MKKIKKIGILTGGGDCPGLNAVIRAVVKNAHGQNGIEVIGFRDGYEGLIKNEFVSLKGNNVSGILTLGGTVLGTSNIANPFKYAIKTDSDIIYRDMSKQTASNYKKHKLDALITVGGDGTLSIALKLMKCGLNIVGVPKTIDNDLSGTDRTFGFDSAVATATEAIDKLHSTAQSHHRAMVIEVMGRYAGWIALESGIAGGGDVILIPEIPYYMDNICRKLREREKSGKKFSIVVVAEGAKPCGGELTVKKVVENSPDKLRLGGVAYKIADEIEKMTGIESRAIVLGHVQRGGTPTPFDRVLATRYGNQAVWAVMENDFGKMVAMHGDKMTTVPIKVAVGKLKKVPADCNLVKCARATGVSFGD